MVSATDMPFGPRLAETLGTPARWRVAGLLTRLPEKEFTGREVARLLDLSPTTAHDALRVLESAGLVGRRAIGRAYVFQANRECYLFPILKGLFEAGEGARAEMLAEARSALGGAAVSVVLFGSVARGTSPRPGDLDLLVVTEDPEGMGDRVDALEARMLRRFGLHVDAKVLTPRELRARARRPYVRAARAEAIVVSGKSLDEVIHG